MEPRELLEQRIAANWPAQHWTELTVLVAVSGGADSVALLHALQRMCPPQAEGRLIAAHYNHSLRGSESEGDELFVRELAAALGVECIVERAPWSKIERVSEAEARHIRYEFLRRAAAQCGARYVAFAHTADDQAETILFRLLRGTGIAGLSGMPRTRPLTEAVTLIRPLLKVRRHTLRSYLQALAQPYREDSSNLNLRFARNRLRNELLPRLAVEYDPAIVEKLLALGAQAAELAAETKRSAEAVIEKAVEMDSAGFRVYRQRIPSFSRQVLREMFVQLWRRCDWPRGEMTFHHWDDLVLTLFLASPARIFPCAVRVETKGEALHISR